MGILAKITILGVMAIFWLPTFLWAYPTIYGNYYFNFQRQLLPEGSFSLYNPTLYFNLHDYIMIKNHFLFTAYLVRNEYSASSKRVDFRPRLDFDLSGNPYKFFFSYLPYNVPNIGGSKVFYKQYQSLASIHPANYPSLRFNWARNDTYDNLPVRRSDLSFRTWSASSSWNKNFFNASLVFSRQENKDRILQERTLLNNAFNASSGLNLTVPGSVYFSSSYNYSYGQREERGLVTSTVNTHSLTALYSTPLSKKIFFNSNYSGRFAFVKLPLQKQKFQDQTLNNSLSYSPVSKMELSLLKGDSKSLSPGLESSQDYWSGLFNYSFPVWKTLDGKVSYSKTYFVQSPQGRYYSDVYYLSTSALAYPGLQVRADLTVNYRSGVFFDQIRYQTSRLLDIRTQPWEKLQFNYYYQSSHVSQKLVLSRVSSENHNFYMSYFPGSGWSLTLNYLERFSPAAVAKKQRVFSGQVYHSFRSAFSINLNYSLNKFSPAVINQPRQSDNLSGQLILFLEKKTVLTLSYSANNLTIGSFSSNVSATLNQQF